MPRPSLKDQRSREILNAFVTCAARYGLEGATQERIALEAGVKRPLLRHYLGNRDEMVSALCAHIVDEFDILSDVMAERLKGCDQAIDIIDLLFDPASETDPRLVLVFQGLTANADAYPQMRQPLLSSINRFIKLIETFLRRTSTARRKSQREAVAYGLAALFMSSDALSPLDPPPEWRAATKRAARALVDSLETSRS